MKRALARIWVSLGVAVVLAVAAVALLAGSSRRAPERAASGSSASSFGLPRGAAWYSETLDTSAPTVADGQRKPERLLIQKWVTWQGYEFQKVSWPGMPAGAGAGVYATGDSEPGFGDWDSLGVHTLPDTPAAVLRLLESGRLEQGQTDRAEKRSSLIWLAQLAAMLADDLNSPAARAAAFEAIGAFPGLQRLGWVRDPQGRLGIGVAEQATDLHPLLIATGEGCQSPLGGAGCDGVAMPSGRYELELIFDPSTDAPLGVRTLALSAIPAAGIQAGTAIYRVTYLRGEIVGHPDIPPPPQPAPPVRQSVPWHLVRASGRQITVGWSSGTCDPSVKPAPVVRAVQTSAAVTLTVLARVANTSPARVTTTSPASACAGVALGGTLSTTLARPIGSRKLVHGPVSG